MENFILRSMRRTDLPKISVIIPFYGVQNYIVKCLKSVKNQTLKDFECILVDDESPDNSYQLAKEFIGSDSRFKIIRQKNKGLGGARNTGLANASGDYICFLDSDDYWSPKFLQVMYDNAIKSNADIVICRFMAVDCNGQSVDFLQRKNSGLWDNKKQIADRLLDWHIAWDKLYKKSIWQGVEFPEHRYYEDFATIYKLAKNTKRLMSVDNVLYFYLQRQESITGAIKEKHIDDLFLTFLEINSENTNSFSNIDIWYALHAKVMNGGSDSVSKKNLTRYAHQKVKINIASLIASRNFKLKTLYFILYKTFGFYFANSVWYLRGKFEV